MSSKYQKSAIYHTDSDCVEYVKQDGGVYYDRIDDFLTLIKSIEGKETVGFKLKGFSYVLQNNPDSFCFDDREFSVIMRAFEVIYSFLGDIIVDDPSVQAAYDEAVSIAANDNIKQIVNIEQVRDKAA